jgi:hypothetical protein
VSALTVDATAITEPLFALASRPVFGSNHFHHFVVETDEDEIEIAVGRHFPRISA